MFGPNCMVIAGNHNIFDVNSSMMNTPKIFENDKGIIIENDVRVGARTVILDGAYISEGSVIAAGAVINCKTKPYSIYGGVPAKFIKFRFSKNQIKQIQSTQYSKEELMSHYE